ncbi:SGNH/GDSL hydrolase family protein [Enterococcus pseudoavium]|uniref:SGNH/GDSL hydrolase family protein n=1 Tax=Enterococcus pseudoavium TaxID=44007 RepID=A0ABU3FL86_9ENTE|nr:SGNH/GDSL hydrolase family protein [Enterococcus pseudoavium]
MTVQITNDGVVGKVPGLTLNLRWTNQSSGLTDLSAFECIDENNSVFKIEYPKNMLNPGKVVASIQIIQNGQVAHSKQFEITVQQLVGEAKGIISKAEYSALVSVLADANKFRTDINYLGAEKVDKGGASQISWGMIAQDAREQISGGKTAVVGKDSVTTPTIVNEAVTGEKIADDAIDTEKISQLDYSVIKNSWARNDQAFEWDRSDNNVVFDKLNDRIILNKPASGYYSGSAVPVELPKNYQLQDFDYYYLHAKIQLGEGHGFTRRVDVYILKSDNSIIAGLKSFALEELIDEKTVDIEIPSTLFDDIKTESNFKVMFGVQDGPGTMTVKDLLVSNVPNQKTLKDTVDLTQTTAQLANDTQERYNFDFSRYPGDYEVVSPNGWFSSTTYTLKNGLYEIWWESSSPGISFNFARDNIKLGQTCYFVGRAKKISGENAGIRFGLLTKPTAFLMTPVTKKISSKWETFIVPVTPDFSQVALSEELFGLAQITAGDTSARILIDNPRLYIPKKAENNHLFDLIKEVGYQEVVQNEFPHQLIKGEFPDFDGITHQKIDAEGFHFVTPQKKVVSDNLMVDTVDFYLEESNQILFATGSIDQNDLLVESNRFYLKGVAGLNQVKVENIPIAAGERLFMDISNQKTLYQASSKIEKTFVQDEGHVIDGNYSGMTFYESEYMIPFNYSVRGRTLKEQVDGYNQTIADIRNEMESLKAGFGSFATDKDGKKYSLFVNEDRSITGIPQIPRETRVFGNSLTLGFETFGMAASNSKKDFSARLLEIIRKKDANASLYREYMSLWEAQTTSESRRELMEKMVFSGNEDLVVVQLGDNVNDDDNRATFEADARTLVDYISVKAPKAKLVWVNGWYNTNFVHPILEELAKNTKMSLIDIRDLSVPSENKSEIGNVWTKDDGTEVIITNAGVASHPGDVGMERIAERIAASLGIV